MRQLPDPDLSLRDACDFIFDSELARRALELPQPSNLSNLLRALIHEIYRLSLSCHLPEFTDHGLPHLCSLVDRVSQWSRPSLVYQNELVVKQDSFSSSDAAVLLIAVLIHDIGMLSQRPEDMPSDQAGANEFTSNELSTWVRRTHIHRLPKLLRRLFDNTQFSNSLDHLIMRRALNVAQSHGKWPWQWDCFRFVEKDAGLAAMLSVADLLDEDAMRCDTSTLMKHRMGTALNCAHWLRHGLTQGRVLVIRGRVSVKLARPPDTDAQMKPVFDALRNHYNLIKLYVELLGQVGANLLGVDFNCTTDVPDEIANELTGWQLIREFQSQSALRYHLLDSFMPESLLDGMRLDPQTTRHLQTLSLIPIQLDEFYRIRSVIPPRTATERAFHALTDE